MDRPTVLAVGGGERMHDALVAALERYELTVETAAADDVYQAAFVTAPDLVLLMGDAATDGGRVALERLARSAATSTVPVILLADVEQERMLHAFQHGIVAVVARSASADGMARRIAELAAELPERTGESSGELGASSFDELTQMVSDGLRSGILSVSGAEGSSTQVVLTPGRDPAEAMAELAQRLRPLIEESAGPLRYEFHESVSARLGLLESDEDHDDDVRLLEGLHIVVIAQDPVQSDLLVQELRAAGALVIVTDGRGTGLDRAAAHYPELVVLDDSGMHGWALPALRALRRDPALRWASLLVVHAAELFPPSARKPEIALLIGGARPLVSPDRELTRRASREEAFDVRLELVGPSRLLRALCRAGLGLRITVRHPKARVEIDLADGLVVGARALTPSTDRPLAEGAGALAAALMLRSGRVHVERKAAPALANVMAPIEDALAAAAHERPPIEPSIPPPSPSLPPPSEPATLLGRVEELLERLSQVMAGAPAPGVPLGSPLRARVPKPALPVPGPRAAPAVPPPGRIPRPAGLRVPKPAFRPDSSPDLDEEPSEPPAASAPKSPVHGGAPAAAFPATPERAPNAPEAASGAPRVPQGAPRPPEAALRAPEAALRAPEAAQKAPEAAQKAPEAAPKAPEAALKAPEAAPRAPEAAPKAPEVALRAPEAAPKAPEAARRAPEVALRAPEAAPKAPEVAPKAPEAARVESEAAPKAPAAARVESEAAPNAPADALAASDAAPVASEATRSAPVDALSASDAALKPPVDELAASDAAPNAPADALAASDAAPSAPADALAASDAAPNAPADALAASDAAPNAPAEAEAAPRAGQETPQLSNDAVAEAAPVLAVGAPASAAPEADPPSDDEHPPAARPRPVIASRRATMTLGTVSAGRKAASEPPPPAAEAAAEPPPAPLRPASRVPTMTMGAVQRVARTPSEPPPGDEEPEELDAVAVPGKLTPPPSLAIAYVPRRLPSGSHAAIGGPTDEALPSVVVTNPPAAAGSVEAPMIAPPTHVPRAAAAAPPVGPARRSRVPVALLAAAGGALVVVAGLAITAVVLLSGGEPSEPVAITSSAPTTVEALEDEPEAARAEDDTDPDVGAAGEPEGDTEPDLGAAGEPAGDADAPETGAEAEAPDGPSPDALRPSGPAGRRRDVPHLLRQANSGRARGQLREAEQLYLRVLNIEPRNPRAHAGLAHLHIARRDPRQAVRWASRLVELGPRIPNNHVLHGDALQAAGRTREARAAWERALALQPGHPAARARLSRR